jgi:biotin transporter BioY
VQTLLRAISICILAVVVILGMGWLYLFLAAQFSCPVINGSATCNVWLPVWASAIFGIPLLLASIVILIYAAIEVVRFRRDRRRDRE